MELRIEKINVSDDKFLVTSIYVQSGDKVSKGDLIYSIESSKAAVDVEAPCDGYVYFADGVEEFSEYPANFLIAQIVDSEKNPFEKVAEETFVVEEANDLKTELPKDIVVTDEAQRMLGKYGINASMIGRSFVSKWDIIDYVNKLDEGIYGYHSTIKRVAMIGAGHAAIQVLDLISHLDDYRAVCIYDDTPEKQNIRLYDVPVVGKIDFLRIKNDYIEGKFDYIINTVGASIPFRVKCYEELTKASVPFCNLIHPTVVIGQNVKMGYGNIIHALSHIGPNAVIGNDNYITAQTSLEHHNVLGSHCTFGPGVKTSGTVTIGDRTRLASGIFVEPYINIGSDCVIASGVIITNDVADNKIVRNKQEVEIVENKFTKTGGANHSCRH